MDDTRTRFKVAEMNMASNSPLPVRGFGMSGLGAVAPAFVDAQGNPISSIESGQPYGFVVPGFQSVWLILNKDGTQVYNASLAVPMALHTAQDSEIGTWQAVAYNLIDGSLIGSVTFAITAAGTGTGTASGISAWLANLTTTEKAVGAGVILLMLAKKKGRK
jgi:hypothetical protein